MSISAPTATLQVFPKQGEFVLSESTCLAYIGGVGSGKTRGGAVRAIRLLCQGGVPVHGMITAPTFPMLRDTTMRTCLEVWPHNVVKEVNKSEMRVVLINGSEVLFRSTDDPDHLRGPNMGFVWMDEAAQSPLLAWQILLGRLREPPAMAFVTSTPRGYNWIYQEWVAKQRGNYQLVQCATTENPYLTQEFIQSLRDSYDVDFAQQEIEGKFILVGGGCYFDVEVLSVLLEEARVGEKFKPYVVGRRYVAAIDPAGEGEDRHSLSILDCQTGEYVVDLTVRCSVGEFAERAYKILTEYNSPLLQIEPNGVGLAMIEDMKGLGYTGFVYGDLAQRKIGQPSTMIMRDRILVGLAEAVRQGSGIVYSRAAIDEMFSFIRDKSGRPHAAEGAHDDRVMSMAWANWVSGQQSPLLSASNRIKIQQL